MGHIFWSFSGSSSRQPDLHNYTAYFRFTEMFYFFAILQFYEVVAGVPTNISREAQMKWSSDLFCTGPCTSCVTISTLRPSFWIGNNGRFIVLTRIRNHIATLLRMSLLPISLSVTDVDAETATDLCNIVGRETGYGLHGSGSIPGSVHFLLFHSVQIDFGVHPASYAIGTGSRLCLFLRHSRRGTRVW
jgi:hypothetical protein